MLPMEIAIGPPLPKLERVYRQYCESCGTLAVHSCRCATCGFSFVGAGDPEKKGEGFRRDDRAPLPPALDK